MPNELYYVLCVIDYCNIVSRRPVMDGHALMYNYRRININN